MTLEQIVGKYTVKRELMDKIEAAVDAAIREMDPRPPEPPIKRRRIP
jgi:hypothetical protein